jgi:hypothetical protein
MHAFKGLERNVVIAIDMEEIGESQYSMLHYTGLSRACLLLKAFLSQPKHRTYNELATAFGARLAEQPVAA